MQASTLLQGLMRSKIADNFETGINRIKLDLIRLNRIFVQTENFSKVSARSEKLKFSFSPLPTKAHNTMDL